MDLHDRLKRPDTQQEKSLMGWIAVFMFILGYLLESPFFYVLCIAASVIRVGMGMAEFFMYRRDR